MYSAVYSLCILLFISVRTEAAPVIFKRVSEISLIINDSCMGQSNSHASAIAATIPLPTDGTKAVNILEVSQNEISDLSKKIQNNHSDFLTNYTQIISPVEKKILVSPVRHDNLSVEQNDQLYIMTQLAIFANYFRSQERDNAYPDDVKDGLFKLKKYLDQAICQLRKTLETSLYEIDKYVTDDYRPRWITLDNEKQKMKRAFVMAELKILSQFIESFTSNSNSVAMKKTSQHPTAA